MIKKSFYETPEAELLLVKFEENIMSQVVTTRNIPNAVEDDSWGEY